MIALGTRGAGAPGYFRSPRWGVVAYEDQVAPLGRGSIRGSDRVVGTGRGSQREIKAPVGHGRQEGSAWELGCSSWCLIEAS